MRTLFRFSLRELAGWVLPQFFLHTGAYLLLRTLYMHYFSIVYHDRPDIFTYWYASPFRYYTPVFTSTLVIICLVSLIYVVKRRLSIFSFAIIFTAVSYVGYIYGVYLHRPFIGFKIDYQYPAPIYIYSLLVLLPGILLLMFPWYKRFFFSPGKI